MLLDNRKNNNLLSKNKSIITNLKTIQNKLPLIKNKLLLNGFKSSHYQNDFKINVDKNNKYVKSYYVYKNCQEIK